MSTDLNALKTDHETASSRYRDCLSTRIEQLKDELKRHRHELARLKGSSQTRARNFCAENLKPHVESILKEYDAPLSNEDFVRSLKDRLRKQKIATSFSGLTPGLKALAKRFSTAGFWSLKDAT